MAPGRRARLSVLQAAARALLVLGCCAAPAPPPVQTPPSRPTRHAYIGVGGHRRDLHWLETQQKLHGITYRPVLINPHPDVAKDNREAVEAYGGVFHSRAAWTSDSGSMRLFISAHELYKGGLDGIYHVRGRHHSYVNVSNIDLARIVEEEAAANDVVVMRMDVEGSEYNLLRHLMLRGVLCKVKRLYLETHAMNAAALNPMRAFDTVLPWLLEPCGVEVFIDSNYHTLWESSAHWPRLDGVCKECPLLYTPLAGAGSSKCPSSALNHCFDERYSCERCCNLRHGVRGDLKCWSREGMHAPVQRLSSGGLGYPLPESVLASIEADEVRLPYKRAARDLAYGGTGPPPVFGYEMCCSGMLGVLYPPLAWAVYDRSQHEAFNPEDPRYAFPVGSTAPPRVGLKVDGLKVPDCSDLRGEYLDSGGGTVRIRQDGCSVEATNEFQRWSVRGRVAGTKLQLWTMSVELSQNEMRWANGAVWRREAG